MEAGEFQAYSDTGKRLGEVRYKMLDQPGREFLEAGSDELPQVVSKKAAASEAPQQMLAV